MRFTRSVFNMGFISILIVLTTKVSLDLTIEKQISLETQEGGYPLLYGIRDDYLESWFEREVSLNDWGQQATSVDCFFNFLQHDRSSRASLRLAYIESGNIDLFGGHLMAQRAVDILQASEKYNFFSHRLMNSGKALRCRLIGVVKNEK